ncbi:MAG: glutamate synthase-related protein [Symbiobacterium sp.]|uniref:glutamate synthase-related protein n=1 Tax=Symbiobacterium sp. TaxID=1971213 RepID=UPI0034644A25
MRFVLSERDIRRYLVENEHDACALMAAVRKDGYPTHAVVADALAALARMVHRSGDVDGEGDGCGVQIDIPRRLWAALLRDAGQDPRLVGEPHFAVAHIFIPQREAYWSGPLKEQICRRMAADGFRILAQRSGAVNREALGVRGRQDEPEFWQVAVLAPAADRQAADRACFQLTVALEAETDLHVCSFSPDTVVYKVRGDAAVLAAYYPDLGDPRCESRAVLGHNRYSTNTATAFERVQPFSVLGHNGEINTIRALREQAPLVGIALHRGGSDSQDLNRTVEGLVHLHGLTLFEAMEMLFPPIIGEIKQMPGALQDLYMYYRQAWGPFAQGPAAILARSGDYLVASVDAMGLRPLWHVETEECLFFSSEPGIVNSVDLVRDPRPLAPGERVGVILPQGCEPELLPYTRLQDRVLQLSRQRFPAPASYRRFIAVGGPVEDGWTPQADGTPAAQGNGVPPAAEPGRANAGVERDRLMAAMGWSAEDLEQVTAMARTGAEPIGSLGYDGPLACLAETRQNLADYFKESVAVVTNPAVDREREIEHFSTRAVLGVRPPIHLRGEDDARSLAATRVELGIPVLLGGERAEPLVPPAAGRRLARSAGTWLLPDLLAAFQAGSPGAVQRIALYFTPTEPLAQALARLAAEAVEAVQRGAQVLLLDDGDALVGDRHWIDPHLILSAVDRALHAAAQADGRHRLRRQCSLVLRSGALRSLHDVVLALGLGADAVNPYLMLEAAAQAGPAPEEGLANLLSALRKGLEKVISTLGIHELRGYARCFSHVGLRPEVAAYFATGGFLGSEEGGLSLARLKADAHERYQVAAGQGSGRLPRTFRFWPRLWKAAGEAAADGSKYADYLVRLGKQERETPVCLRHLLDFRPHGRERPLTAEVDTTIEGYRYPITISGMSFGSQGETAFRAYAEAARRLDIVCMNGEGGEIPDMVGRYWRWRGQQVASGRFGVHAEMLNGSRFIEIKIGQGAKPGEGGHLPGAKVSAKVARARNATVGVDLISPSNNHDISSIEDLAQLVEELRTVNPLAKIVVKMPVVPGIGTIAVGVAKAGADVVALCGYDGGTGAARQHALRHAGLPVEIGVRQAHLALVAAGIRDRVEIWADSGMRSGTDVVKMMLLGANRVGFATLAMVAVGCTICRGCHLDTCHVGIATQIESCAEARARGLRAFVPRVYEEAVERLVTLFTCVGEEVRQLTAELGFRRTQDLVGRAELLWQARGLGRVDLSGLIAPVPWEVPAVPAAERVPVRRYARSELSREIAAVAAGRARAGESAVCHRQAGVTARDRIIGTAVAGAVARARVRPDAAEARLPDLPPDFAAQIELAEGSIAGNGLAAFSTGAVSVRVQGGAQDGVGKGMLGGRVVILKHRNRRGQWVNGAVGKSFAYGAQRGLFVVQGDADARCGIRLSGADLILGGRIREPLRDDLGSIGTRANLKGFAFEYMTQGRVVVLGDPGPWICSGMTGGVVYVRLQPELGLDEAALRRRIAKGARVQLTPVGEQGEKDLTELLSVYHRILLEARQPEEAAEVMGLMLDCGRHFVALRPAGQQADPGISTE